MLSSDDLRTFSDIGSDFIEIKEENGSESWSFFLEGERVTISKQHNDEFSYILSSSGGEEKFVNEKGLLSSKRFGDLKQWARNQKTILTKELPREPIETEGSFSIDVNSNEPVDSNLEDFEGHLKHQEGQHGLHAVVIDGPAGIGKTTQIKRLSKLRADRYHLDHGRLVLHVESRGRILQNVTDLISASLHAIRAKPTCEQLFVLVKHGLILLTIDGFDELADPNGYQMAWSQLDEALEQSYGNGQVILSGRETFVSPSRMQKSLPFLQKASALLSQYTMKEVSRNAGIAWLANNGWAEENLESSELFELFSDGSYAARPFFLQALADSQVFEEIQNGSSVDLLSTLIEALAKREVGKFGDDVLRSINKSDLETYIYAVCEELARDMADSQGEVLPSQTIAFISEMCVPGNVDHNTKRVLIQRAQTLPFLTKSEGRNSFRFAHRQYYVFFLGKSAIRSISDGETPKYIRNNILGAEFLESFDKVVRDLPVKIIKKFQNQCISSLEDLSVMNRSAGNVASLLVTSSCSQPLEETVSITGVSIDEVLVTGELTGLSLSGVAISSLYADSADLSQVSFSEDCHIVSLHANNNTVLPKSFPVSSWIEFPDQTINKPDEVAKKISQLKGLGGLVQIKLPANPDLVRRMLMYRPFWLKLEADNSEPIVQRIVQDPDWEKLFEWLKKNEYVRVETRNNVAGKPGTFIHFRMAQIHNAIRKTLKIVPHE